MASKDKGGKKVWSLKKVGKDFSRQKILVTSQSAKSLKRTLEEGVFVESAFNMRCHIVKNTLPHIDFSAILPAGLAKFSQFLLRLFLSIIYVT